MPCLLGCLSLSIPRFVLLLLFLFSNYLGRAYETNFWPLMGFLFMPMTTLAYAAARNEHGDVSGVWAAVVIVAVLMDFGVVGFGRTRFRRRGGPPRDGGPRDDPPRGREITVKGERVG